MSRLGECFSQQRLHHIVRYGIEGLDRSRLLAHLGTGCSRCRKSLRRLAKELQPGELEPVPIHPRNPAEPGRIFTGQDALARARPGRCRDHPPDPLVQALRRAVQVEASRLDIVGLLPTHAWVARRALRLPLGFPHLVLEELRHVQSFGPPRDSLAPLANGFEDLVGTYRWIRNHLPESAGLYFAVRFGELLALAWVHLGDEAFRTGKPKAAGRALRIAHRLLQTLVDDPESGASPGWRQVLAIHEETRGKWALETSKPQRARLCFATAEELLYPSTVPNVRLSARMGRAKALCSEGDLASAAELLSRTEPMARASGHARIWLEAVHVRAAVELELGDLSRCRQRLEACTRLYLEWGDLRILSQREWMLGVLHLRAGSPLSRGLGHFQVAWALFGEVGWRQENKGLGLSCLTQLLVHLVHPRGGVS